MMVLQMQRVCCLFPEVLLAVEYTVDAADDVLEPSGVIMVPLACCQVQSND